MAVKYTMKRAEPKNSVATFSGRAVRYEDTKQLVGIEAAKSHLAYPPSKSCHKKQLVNIF